MNPPARARLAGASPDHHRQHASGRAPRIVHPIHDLSAKRAHALSGGRPQEGRAHPPPVGAGPTKRPLTHALLQGVVPRPRWPYGGLKQPTPNSRFVPQGAEAALSPAPKPAMAECLPGQTPKAPTRRAVKRPHGLAPERNKGAGRDSGRTLAVSVYGRSGGIRRWRASHPRFARPPSTACG